MAKIQANGIDIEYEEFGSKDDPMMLYRPEVCPRYPPGNVATAVWRDQPVHLSVQNECRFSDCL